MSYLFSTDDEQRNMLATIGVDSIDAILADQIPESLQLKRDLKLPPPLSELELEQLISSLAGQNTGRRDRACFLGGGVYDHFVPAAVDAIAGRSEFYTAYTPYQAEASQGSLQAFFEYQSLICELTGMDVSNASLYEGGTAVSEAVFMAMRATKRHDRIVLLGSVNPEYRDVVRTYLGRKETEVVTIPTPNGTANLEQVAAALNESTACLVIQQPNVFGCLEHVEQLCEIARKVGALSIVSFDPLSLGVLKRPGDYGADIAVAEGQSLGIPMQFGGPYLGVITCRNEFVRQMPGRLIGETTDREGRRCFVLTIQAREQHIRREKATSNICTNQGLLALRATVYLSLLGPQGLKEVAELCCRKAHYAATELSKVDGIEVAFDRPFFKEFTIRSRRGAAETMRLAREAGFDIGPGLKKLGACDCDNALLVAVTECRTKDEIDRLVSALK